MKTIIHVNQHKIRANKCGGSLPVISAKTYRSNTYGNSAKILDAKGDVVAEVVYRPDKPLSCGAKCWIETRLKVLTE